MEQNPYQSPRTESRPSDEERSAGDFRATTIRALGVANLLMMLPFALCYAFAYPGWLTGTMLLTATSCLYFAIGVCEYRLITSGVYLQVGMSVAKTILMASLLPIGTVVIALPSVYVIVLNLAIVRLMLSPRSKAVVSGSTHRGPVPPPLWYPLLVWMVLLGLEILALWHLADNVLRPGLF